MKLDGRSVEELNRTEKNIASLVGFGRYKSGWRVIFIFKKFLVVVAVIAAFFYISK